MDERREDGVGGISGKSAVGWSVLIVAVGVAAWGSRFWFRGQGSANVEPPSIVAADAPSPQAANKPIDWDAWRRRAWEKIGPRLDEADRAAATALDEELRSIGTFFEERRPGAKPFAEAVLSLGGKWEFVKSKLPTADDQQHLRYLNEQFERYVFKIDDLRTVVESAVAAYVSRLEGIENRLLVDVRADLSDRSLGAPTPPKFVASDAEFHGRYERLLETVAADVARDFNVAASREVTSLVAGEVAAVVAVRVASAVAARLGVSAGVLGTGAASGWATFGVGLVAAVVIDAAINQLVRAAGYDPVEKVREKVDAVLGQVRSLLVDGDPEARAVYEKLRQMAVTDPDAAVREECRRAAEAIDGGGRLGLRREVLKLQDARAKIRREALRRLILSGET